MSLLTPRQVALVEGAAADLRDGKVALSHEFLVDNDVTLSEAFALSEHLALGATLLLQVAAEVEQGGLAGRVGMERFSRALMAGVTRA